MFFGKKKNPHDIGCFACHVIVMAALFVAALASLLEIIMSHYVFSEKARDYVLVFGTNAGSLSLIAFAVTTAFWVKSLKACLSGCEACGTMGKK